MTKEEYLQVCEARYEKLCALGKIDNFYDYEKEFVTIWQGMGRAVFEKNLGAVHAISVKKLTTVGWVVINNKHPFSKGHNGFQISGLMQERMVYAGHLI